MQRQNYQATYRDAKTGRVAGSSLAAVSRYPIHCVKGANVEVHPCLISNYISLRVCHEGKKKIKKITVQRSGGDKILCGSVYKIGRSSLRSSLAVQPRPSKHACPTFLSNIHEAFHYFPLTLENSSVFVRGAAKSGMP